MNTENSEKIKLYIVIGLLIVAAIVAYFRFFYKNENTDSKSDLLSTQGIAFDISKIQNIKPIKKPQKFQWPSNGASSNTIRDIFAKAELTASPNSRTQVNGHNDSIGALELKGIIIGGNQPMAVIDNKFIKIGERIGEYQLVKIGSNEVVLQSNSDTKVLRILGTAPK